MKFLITLLTLTIITSCGKNDSKKLSKTQDDLETSALEESFNLPKVGFQKSVTLNYRFEHTYENLSISPGVMLPVPGAKPFVLFMNDKNRIRINYNPRQDIKKVSYLDYGKNLELANILKTSPLIEENPKLKSLDYFSRSFSHGDHDAEYADQDMAGKVYVVESEAADAGFISKMTVMFWIECEGGLSYNSDIDYTCPSENYRFNYKLLKYKLEELSY